MPAPGTVIAGIVATNRFGFMTMERDGARWRMVAHDARGVPQIACTLQERQANCVSDGAMTRIDRGDGPYAAVHGFTPVAVVSAGSSFTDEVIQ